MLSIRSLKRLHVTASFDLHRGECIALQGASGVGKTVLLRAIADLDPNEGFVELDGMPRDEVAAPKWRRQVTYVAAESGWWADTVQEHFDKWEEAIPLIEQVGMPPSCGRWRITRLSTGERQRLGLIRALTLRPRVLLLDEPTSALDTVSIQAVERIIAACVAAGTSIIWSTHDKAQANRVASRMFVMSAGRVEEYAI